MLSRYAPVDPASWRFAVGEHGKPRLAGAPISLDFNISHSGDWLVCAVTGGTAVGVDIEHCRERRDVMKLAGRFFNAAELEDLQASSGATQVQRFYDYWTLKEASVKSLGQALAPALESCSFQLTGEPGASSAVILDMSQDSPGVARYWLFDPLPGYRLALCWRSTVAPCLRLFQQDVCGAVVERSMLPRGSSAAVI